MPNFFYTSSLGEMGIRSSVNIYYEAKEAQGVAANTMRTIRGVMENWAEWAEANGIRSLKEVNVPVVQAYIRGLEAKGLAPNTVHIYFRNLRTYSYYFEDLTEGELRSPFHNKGLKAPKVPKGKKASVSSDEVLRFVNALNGDEAVRNKAFFLLAFDSGLRLAEICALRVKDVNLISGRIEVLHGKGDKYRVSFVSGVTLKALRRYIAKRPGCREWEPLFLSQNGSFLTEQGMQAIRYKAERECGIKLGGFHALRRGFAKEFLKNGGDLFTLQNLLGHTELNTTRGYVQMEDSELQEIYIRNSPLEKRKRN